MSNLSVALLQKHYHNQTHTPLDELIAMIEQAAAEGAELIVLPELHNGLYFCQQEDYQVFNQAESIPGPTTKTLAALAQRLQVVIVGSLFERRGSGLYHNTAVVLERDGHLAGCYRKMHIPDDPGYYEKFYFTPGDLGFTPIHTSVGCLGVLVCWDQWFPEAARAMALAGADVLIYPTAIGWDKQESSAEQQRGYDAWLTIQRSHAIANGLPVLSCNRVGFESDPANTSHGIDFWGSSFVCGAQGEYLAQASSTQQQIIHAQIDKHASEHTRRRWPFLRDRRIEAYAGLTRRFID